MIQYILRLINKNTVYQQVDNMGIILVCNNMGMNVLSWLSGNLTTEATKKNHKVYKLIYLSFIDFAKPLWLILNKTFLITLTVSIYRIK